MRAQPRPSSSTVEFFNTHIAGGTRQEFIDPAMRYVGRADVNPELADMTVESQRLREAKDVVRRMLSGPLPEDDDTPELRDDVGFFCARIVEREDPEWLRARLSERALPIQGRLQVVRLLGPMAAEGIATLRAERPGLAPELDAEGRYRKRF